MAFAQESHVYGETIDYPDVWDWQAEQYKRERSGNISFFHLESGDVLISFFWVDEVDGERQAYHDYFTFFGRQNFNSLDEAFISLQGGYDRQINRAVSAFLDKKELPNKKEIELDNGWSHCERKLDTHLSIYDSVGSEYSVDETTLFFLPSSPFVYPDARCEWGTDPLFTHNVAIFSSSLAVPLHDNTFLIADDDLGTIIRFDENLESYSALIGTSLFAVDHEDLREFIQKFPNSDDPLRLRNAWGYGLNYPVILDELEQMIIKVSNRSEWLLEIE